MKLSSKAESILAQINTKTLLGDLRKIAKDIKKDHELAIDKRSLKINFKDLEQWLGTSYK